MRYLHPVGLLEKFVATGVYIDYRENIPTGITETWSIHEQPDGAQFVRVDIDARKADGSSRLIEAWRAPDKEGRRIERVDVQVFGSKTAPVQEVRATYTFFDDHVEIGRTIDKQPRQYEELPLPSDYVVYGGSRVLLGYAIDRISRSDLPEVPVFACVTHVSDRPPSENRLRMESVTLLGEETIELSGRLHPARHFERQIITTPEKKPDHFWIDRYNILLKHEDTNECFTLLTQYARRPDPQ